MSKDNFIGGRVPQEVKRELKARAVADGKTMQELLEDIIMGFLEGREEIKNVDQDELINGIRQAIQETELPVPVAESEITETDVQEVVDTAIEKAVNQVIQQLAHKQAVLEERLVKQMESSLAAVKEDLEDAISDIENNMVYAEDENDEPGDFTGFRKLMAEEVNCVIVSAFEDYLEGEDFDRVEVLRRISNQFLLEAEEDRSPECRDNFRLVLPEDFAEEVAQVVRLAIEDMEFQDDKSDVFGKLYQLFEQAAVLALKKQNTIQLSLSETEYEAVDRLLASMAENKEVVRDRRSLIRYLIGQELIREGRKSFLSEDAFLVNAGKIMVNARLK